MSFSDEEFIEGLKEKLSTSDFEIVEKESQPSDNPDMWFVYDFSQELSEEPINVKELETYPESETIVWISVWVEEEKIHYSFSSTKPKSLKQNY